MTAVPMTLDEALNHQGYTIDEEAVESFPIVLEEGTIIVPAAVRSKLTWRRSDLGAPEPGDDLWLGSIPVFDELYRPVLLSNILDRYRTRRLAYDTPGQWRLALRRWSNLSMTVYNLRYRSTAVALPLDDSDSLVQTDRTVEATSHGLDVGSDFPQSLISGDESYATAATDRRVADNATTGETVQTSGRSQSVMELLAKQRDAYLNVDEEVVQAMEPLFLGIFDQGEGAIGAQYGLGPYGLTLGDRWGW